MKAPRFWWNSPERPGWQARLLAPAAMLWRTAAHRRAAGARPARCGAPVICVGNLTAGGSGKTPTVAWLLVQLQAAGQVPHVLTRGYGGSLAGPHLVDPGRDGYRDVGDEAMLLAALAPTWVSRDRVAGAEAAAAAGASVVVMDDGFQNPALAKDLSLLIVDAGQGFGNGRLIPAGPLREPVPFGLARADGVVLIGALPARHHVLRQWPALQQKPLYSAQLSPLQTGLGIAGERVLAFAGIGRPGKFFETLQSMGAVLVGTVPFADHYAYPPEVLNRLARQARSQNAMLVTTEKDAVRLPAAFRREVMTVQITFAPEEPGELMRFVLGRLERVG